MLFGSERVFSLIGEILNQDDGEAYEPLCKILYEDIELLINKYCQGIQAADKEDLKQEIVWSVIKDLPRYYNQSANKTEKQRNTYLKTLTYNACMDFFRRAKRSVLSKALDIDDLTLRASEDDFSSRVIDREAFLTALKGAFEFHTTPDKLMAFVYNRLIEKLTSENGSPKSIIDRFDGQPLSFMYEQMVADLNSILGIRLPDDVVAPLRTQIYSGSSEAVFHMTAHIIADSSSRIVNKVKEQNKNEY